MMLLKNSTRIVPKWAITWRRRLLPPFSFSNEAYQWAILASWSKYASEDSSECWVAAGRSDSLNTPIVLCTGSSLNPKYPPNMLPRTLVSTAMVLSPFVCFTELKYPSQSDARATRYRTELPMYSALLSTRSRLSTVLDMAVDVMVLPNSLLVVSS
ncbi:hypothetical protein H257_09081 [Aphanomyces astaci]|uniref:Uncharacterized protein n=1 Tax=Aphanomyces astaci TaxID=112090 RepID=W4GDQ3_APHAT|nr:hypothetical protein H257_09081 [Aphanomyces astaci]ETV77194.1 hypothetical protein H257_09081 [Aphanomyces astaci]|eukprot:XP_009833500.1 hypothetical protein H257_09081 [Aphanomyces astaci]